LEIKRLTEIIDEILVEVNNGEIDELYNDEKIKGLLKKFYHSKIVENNLQIFREVFKGLINDYIPKNRRMILEPLKEEIELPKSSKIIRHYVISKLVLEFFPILLDGYDASNKMYFSKIADCLTSLEVVDKLSKKFSDIDNVKVTLTTKQFEENWESISDFCRKFNEGGLNFIFKEEISKFGGKIQRILEEYKEDYFFDEHLQENIQRDHYYIIKTGNLGDNLTIHFLEFLGTDSLSKYGF
jgi:hypothetical protein